MTLVEFLHPIRKGKHRDLVLAVLFYTKKNGMTQAEIMAALMQAKIPNAKTMNVSQVLTRSAAFTDTLDTKRKGASVFKLTRTGEVHVRSLNVPTDNPVLQNEVTSLEAISAKVTDETVRSFIDEAILCLRADALRGAIVFLWSGVMRTLHDKALEKGTDIVTRAIQKQDPKARPIKKTDDFSYVKDRTFLASCVDIGILDKGQKDVLIDALNLRNKCGHPTKYRPESNKACSFIEDVVGIVFL